MSFAAALVTAAAVLVAASSAAQVEPEPGGRPPVQHPPSQTSDSRIEEIVVRGSAERSGDYAETDSVTTFSAADLNAIGAQSLDDIAAFTPNLEIVSPGATTPSFFIRGVGLNDFNPTATSAVAIYQDDVNLNAQGLQLGTLFDIESVNVLRGPQGTGLARNASAGAIKLYTRKPTGNLNGYLKGTLGNYRYQDYEGAVEGPIWSDVLSARAAFRWSDRDGYVKNRCGGLPPVRISTKPGPYSTLQIPIGFCRTNFSVSRLPNHPLFFPPTFTEDVEVPAGLPTEVNDLHNWAARTSFLFEPTLETSWTAGAQYSRRDETTRLGVAYGTGGPFLGTEDVEDYKKPEVAHRQRGVYFHLACQVTPSCVLPQGSPLRAQLFRIAQDRVSKELAEDLDPRPFHGYYDRIGPTENEIIYSYVRGETLLPLGMELRSVTGFSAYDRLIDIDLDFSPTILAEIVVKDDTYQITQDLALSGDLGDADPLTWGIGGLFLYERLDVASENRLRPDLAPALISGRRYAQQIRSFAVYGEFSRDFWDDLTLDGGVRWNQENKDIRMKALWGLNYKPEQSLDREKQALWGREDQTWEAPTGTIRLTYRLSEKVRASWKYTRGWKAGHYNATTPADLRSRILDIDVAKPETLDAFETGLSGKWFHGDLSLELNLFYYAYDNYQLFTYETQFGQPPAFVVLNAENAENYGAEADLVIKPWPGATINLRPGWMESQFLDFVQEHIVTVNIGGTSYTLIREVDAKGNRLLNSPEFKVSAVVEQAIPLGPYGTLIPRYDGVWTAEVFYDATEGRGVPDTDGTFFLPEHTIAQPAYFLHNLRLSYAPPSQNPVIGIWVKNLENKVYRQFGADAQNFLETTLYFPGEPRTYGIDVIFHF